MIPKAVLDAASLRIRELVLAGTIVSSCGALEGCATRQASHDGVPLPSVSIVPPCDESEARVDLLESRPDPLRHKPSPGMTRVVVDLRIRARGLEDLWLMVDEETFPSVLNEVSKMKDGSWLFSGNETVFARKIGRSADVTVRDVPIASSGRKVPVLLATMDVGGVSPERWVAQGGEGDHRRTFGEETVRLGVTVICATWFDIRPRAEPSDGS